ncbi:MAG: aminotransferase class V-fold PLP-dependent enzyme [Candidatus Zixiibacteriota bacterium]|nr:MAG: aminotransferase class V-fold PLP-dependent enzyme [candidate division Zixibacteria bacterium]
MIDLKIARSYFDLNKDIIYLNHASHGPLPLPARKAYDDFLDSWQKTEHEHDIESFRIIKELRGKLAKMIGADAWRLGLSYNTTSGLSIIAGGFPWERGDNIVLSETEFPACVYPWVSLRRIGLELRFAPTDKGFIDEDSLMALVDKNTRVISISWVQFNNGFRTDINKLGEFCRSKDILLCVDGIQGMGVIPINVPDNDIDLFTSGCAKWMLGPCGTGFFYLSERAEERLQPINIGWLSVDWNDDFTDLLRYDLPERKGPSKYEYGTYAYQDIRALNASVDLHLSFDRVSVWDYIKSLTGMIIDKIVYDDRFALKSSKMDDRRSGIVAFGSKNARSLYDYLRENKFIVSFREGNIRVSPYFYNTPEEIESFIRALDNYS